MFPAVSEVIQDRFAFILAVALQTALHALESKRVLALAVSFGVFGDVVHALQKVGHLCLGGLGVASTAIRRQTNLVELLHLAFAKSAKFDSVNERL